MNGYAVVIEQADDGGHGGWSPELPGCVALGDTSEEAAVEMREAIREHVEPVPAPTAVRVDLMAAA